MSSLHYQPVSPTSGQNEPTELRIAKLFDELGKPEKTPISAAPDGFYVFRYRKGAKRGSAEIYSDEKLDEARANDLARSMNALNAIGDGWNYICRPARDVKLPENAPRYW